MKKIAFLAFLIVAVVSADVKWAPAESATPVSNLLELLPDGNAVAVIDFQKIVGSALWAAISKQDKFKSAIDKTQSEISDLGLRLSDVHMVALAFPGANMSDPTVAVSGVFDQNNLLALLRASEKVKLTSSKYKGFDLYQVKRAATVAPNESSKETNAQASEKHLSSASTQKDQTSFVFHDANTVVAGSLQAVRASIDVKTGGRTSIAQNGKIAEVIAQNATAAIRFAVVMTPAMTGGLQSSDFPFPDFTSVNLIFGAIDVSSGIDFNATLRNDTPEHAKAIAERFNSLLGMARGYLGAVSDPKVAPIVEALKTVNIVSADIDVKITGNVPLDVLNGVLSPSLRKGQL